MTSPGKLGKPIVLDFGAGSIKVGFSGDPSPKFIIPNLHGIAKFPRVLQTKIERDTFIGSQVNAYRGLLDLHYTMHNGDVVDNENLGLMFAYIFGHSVLNVDPREHPILVTEPVLPSFKTKEIISQHLFEVLSVPAVSFACAPVLSLYGNGFHTGCVLESGAGVSSTICVCDGYTLTHSAKRSNLAGRSVTDFLQKNLFREGYYLSPNTAQLTLDEIKHNTCQISPIPFDRDFKNEICASVPYTLPDGTTINVGKSRILSPELLFRPDLIGDESSGLSNMIFDSIGNADHEVRKKIYKYIILSGGNTLFEGLLERVLYELKLLTGNKTAIKIHSPKHRMTAAFKGGSLVCMLDSFNGLWMSRSQYIEKK